MSNITAHMVVKNEDQWVWFAIQSILPHVSTLLVTDTGSTDHTLEIIKNISSSKIILLQVNTNNPQQITDIRQTQLNLTKTDWFWLIDGDEIYPDKTAKEIIHATNSNFEGVVVRRYDLLGDVYHRQRESIGQYQIFGRKGHLLGRVFNKKKIKGLYVKGVYPNEGYFDEKDQSTRNRNPKDWFITQNYLYHAMYLKRSSSGSNLRYVFNRSKYKIETGIKINDQPPEVFSLPRPPSVPDPTHIRSYVYEAAASIVTPIKNLKRAVL